MPSNLDSTSIKSGSITVFESPPGNPEENGVGYPIKYCISILKNTPHAKSDYFSWVHPITLFFMREPHLTIFVDHLKPSISFVWVQLGLDTILMHAASSSFRMSSFRAMCSRLQGCRSRTWVYGCGQAILFCVGIHHPIILCPLFEKNGCTPSPYYFGEGTPPYCFLLII